MQDQEYRGEKLWNDTDPNDLVVELSHRTGPGSALDLGAGKGRNALYLARQGWEVVAVDREESALKEAERESKEERAPITIIRSDVNEYAPHRQFDVVICDMVLHFLSPEQVVSMIEKMKQWTKPGGYNVVTGYTDVNPPGKRPYLFKHGELSGHYQGWEMTSYEESPTLWFIKPGEAVPRHNYAAYLLARKPV